MTSEKSVCLLQKLDKSEIKVLQLYRVSDISTVTLG